MWTLGIDTSNYTTSAALYDGELALQEKLPLPVGEGELGLRQSDAVFLHVKQLPELLEKLLPGRGEAMAAVGVSVCPRDAQGSYMPCFLAGESAARSVAAALQIPWLGFSHQAGHIAAALLGTGRLDLMGKPFLAFHASGGTTECLLVEPGGETVFNIEIVGRSLDLAAGQVIDRVGKMLGLPFPAGPGLEKLAAGAKRRLPPKTALREGDCCLSGLENQCRSLLEQGAEAADVAAFCQASLGEAVLRMARMAAQRHGGLPFLFAGGVMSNLWIKNKIVSEMPGAMFAPPRLSTDNAVGAAVLAAVALERGNRGC